MSRGVRFLAACLRRRWVRRGLGIALLATLVAGLPWSGLRSKASPSHLVVGLVGSGETAAHQALAESLGEALGIPVDVRPYREHVSLLQALRGSEVQAAFLNAFDYVKARRFGAAVILKPVRYGSTGYRGQWVTRTPGPNELGDLRGKRVAFVDPASLTGYLLGAIQLERMGIDKGDFEPLFVRSHEEVLDAVATGRASAGLTFEGAERLEGPPGSGRSRWRALRVIGFTPTVPHAAVAVAPGTDDPFAARIAQALQTAASTPAGQTALASLGEYSGFEPASDPEYDIVEALAARLGAP